MTETIKIGKQACKEIRISAGNPPKPKVDKSAKASIRFDDVISLTEMKDLARRLPLDGRARELMFALNDNETRWIALGQLLLIHKILYEEPGR